MGVNYISSINLAVFEIDLLIENKYFIDLEGSSHKI
jgi:hypothetical protein